MLRFFSATSCLGLGLQNGSSEWVAVGYIGNRLNKAQRSRVTPRARLTIAGIAGLQMLTVSCLHSMCLTILVHCQRVGRVGREIQGHTS